MTLIFVLRGGTEIERKARKTSRSKDDGEWLILPNVRHRAALGTKRRYATGSIPIGDGKRVDGQMQVILRQEQREGRHERRGEGRRGEEMWLRVT